MDRDGISQSLLSSIPLLLPLLSSNSPRALSSTYTVNLGTQQNFDFTIGVISAFSSEVSSLAASLLDSQIINLNGSKAWEGHLGISNVLILPGGMGPQKAADAAHTLISRGVSAILCSGTAGALDPDLQVGDLVIADWVMDAKDRNSKFECDSNWNTEAKRKAEQDDFCIANGGVISVDTPVFTPKEKGVLRKDSGGSVVDMESATVRRLASGIPFLSVRGVRRSLCRGRGYRRRA